MPTIRPGDKVLVTGSNGYIAIWVVNELLKKGYSVRGTIRKEEKGKHLKEVFKKYGDKLELCVVPDITAEGAFDEAVKGVDGIAHMASPFHQNFADPEEYNRPAVQGTIGVLQSAFKNNRNLKRIVITSSCAAILNPVTRSTGVFSEKDWAEDCLKAIEEKGRDAAPMMKYCASKTLAEKAAWDFHNKHKSDVNWDISVMNPPYVFGPALHEVPSPDKLNESLGLWYKTVVEGGPKSKDLLSNSNAWVDVRDIANAHVLALEKEAAGGERIIIAGGPYIWQEWLDAANEVVSTAYPAKAGKLSKGFPEITQQSNKKYSIDYDLTKVKKILGITFRSKKESTKDMLAFFAERGW